MNCKICSPPSSTICPECEAKIREEVRRIVARVGRVRETARKTEVLKAERRLTNA